jgi:hypothetical protein
LKRVEEQIEGKGKVSFKSVSFILLALLLSVRVNAAVVTQGYLTSDDGTGIITDSLNNVEYLRLDLLAPLTYAQTMAVLDTQEGGGWSIATPTDALNFTTALFGGAGHTCSHTGVTITGSPCGTLTGWFDGKLGDNFDLNRDIMWFLNDAGGVDYLRVWYYGGVEMLDLAGGVAFSDNFSDDGPNSATPVTWLVVRPTVVPLPPAVWLFGFGLVGLIGIARRNKEHS